MRILPSHRVGGGEVVPVETEARPRAMVTGAAGFIGSQLAGRLLSEGYEVTGVDRFSDHYARSVKEHNVAGLMNQPGFRLVEADLCTAGLGTMLEGVDYVFHQAAQPGVRVSWGDRFDIYLRDNVLATQRLLEAALPFLPPERHDSRSHPGLKRFILASSSSVYGNSDDLPLRETSPCRPYSPYGVTKLAAEHLAMLYHNNFGVPAVALRYFTVYGPGQRPDMAFHRFLETAYSGGTITIYGDGEQTRDYTYVSDIVEANLLACRGPVGRVYNIGGGSRVTVNRVIELLQQVAGVSFRVEYIAPQHGDVRHTWADTNRANHDLGYRPKVDLREGLRTQAAWMRALSDVE